MSTFEFDTEKLIGTGIHPSIATGKDGILHITYTRPGMIIYKYYDPTTGVISNEEIVTNSNSWAPQIAVSNDGDIHITWELSIENVSGYIGYARRISGTWKISNNLHKNTYRAMIPRIAVDSLNRAHIVFWKNTGADLDATYARGQYNRLNISESSLIVEKEIDIFGWDGSRTGCVVTDSNNIIHVFNAESSQINHWTVSENGIFTISTPLPKPADAAIEKFMETTAVSTGAGGGFYGFSKDAGDPLLPKEIFHTRIGGLGSFSKIVWNEPLIGLGLQSVGDKIKAGISYAIFAGIDKKGRILAVDQDGIISGPTLFATSGEQHDGVDRHGPTGVSTNNGIFISYQDNRSGLWQIFVRKVSLSDIVITPILGVPRQSDWIDAGEILASGPEGSWDVRFGGALSPCAVIKRNGIYHLYYIGADGDMVGDPESTTDPGPSHRSVGVATSIDGIHYTKYQGNPILRYLPTNDQEEGTFSLGACLDENNNVLIYYSTMQVTSPLNVDSDVSLAISSNGLDFTHIGDVLKSNNPSVWGYGDELFPVGALKTAGKYYIWYIAKGVSAMWDVGLASGVDKFVMTSTKPLIVYGLGIPNDIVGGGMPVIVGDKLVHFYERGRAPSNIEVYWTPISNPEELHLSDIYTDVRIHTTVFKDQDTGTWFMYFAAGRYSIEAKVFEYCIQSECDFTITQQN